MDTLYIGDIPNSYHYAVFGSDYITLYDRVPSSNSSLQYYRIYNNNGFYYTTGITNFGVNPTSVTNINVSDNWLYRRDISDIFTVSFIFVILFVFVFNIVTSVFKKGGVFGGLL